MFFDTESDLLIRCNLYIACGIIVLIPNSICVLIFNSSKDFRQRFVFFTMLSLSDMINGLSFILSGTGRSSLIQSSKFYFETSSFECMSNYIWPIFMLVGGQLPATFHCLLTVERVLAVTRVSWYRSRWTWRHRMYLTVFGIFGCMTLNLIALLISARYPTHNMNRICAVMNSTGIIYGTIHYSWIAVSYLIAFIVVLNLFWKSHEAKFLNSSERKKQMAILILSGISVVMVSIPNIVLVADEWYGGRFDVLLVGISYLFYGFQSCFNLPIFYFFRLDFKRRLHDFFRCRKLASVGMPTSNEGSRHQLSKIGLSISPKTNK